MTLSDVKNSLQGLSTLEFQLPSGQLVPTHFHITEVGAVTKHFIDCGGTVRHESVVNFQLWEDGDFDHRLAPQKLADIIALSERVLGLEDGEIEVEYQSDTIGKYGLSFDGQRFILTSKFTNCLAQDKCGVPAAKPRFVSLNIAEGQACTPGGGCC